MTEYWDSPVRSKTWSIVNKRNYWQRFRNNPTGETLLDFGEIWWSYRHFGEPRHFVEKRILEKGYTPIEVRDRLESLPEEGYSAINADIPGMGVATLSEVIEVIDPSQ